MERRKLGSIQRTAAERRKFALLPPFVGPLRVLRDQRAIRTTYRICWGYTKKSFVLPSTCGMLSMGFRCYRSWQSKITWAKTAFIGYEPKIRSKHAGLQL